MSHMKQDKPGSPRVRDVGERHLIAVIHRLQPPAPAGTLAGIGDDAAVVVPPAGEKLLVSTDMLVEGVHFRRDWMTAEQVGEKAVAVNVSDIAAMGGRPYGLLTSIALPPDLPVDFVEGFYRGFARAADQYGAVLIGGDTVGSPGPVVVDVTVLGFAEVPVLRRGGRPGDRLVVTGRLGGSRAGFELLRRGLGWPGRHASERAVLARHLRPEARVAAGRELAQRAHAMTDVSDGLAEEVGLLVDFGGIGAVVRAESLPLDTPTKTVARHLGADPVIWALYGGEDYELLAAVPPSAVPELTAALRRLGIPLTEIGELVDRPGLTLIRGGREEPLARVTPEAFDHFRSPSGASADPPDTGGRP
jgi:thiamine-monophosphate kinase